MKILYTVTKSEAGGAQTHVAQLAKFFVGKGDEVYIMAAPGGWLEKKTAEIGARFIPNRFFSNAINPINCWRAIRLVEKTARDIQPDIIHAHSSGAGFYTRVAIKNKIPTVYTAHGWGFNIGVPIWQKYLAVLGEKIGADFCVKIICVADFVRNLGIKHRVAKPDKFTVIHNGVEEFLPGKDRVADDRAVRLVFIGRLAAPKLPHLFLRALAELPEEVVARTETLIVGYGASKELLQNYAKEMKLSRVKMLGEQSRQQIADILTQADIFVLLSRWEGLPLTVLEAMSAGLPVIASRVGGIPEIVDETTGILVANDLEEIKKALVKLINDPIARRALGEAGQRKTREKFSLTRMCERVHSLYENIIKL